MKGLLQDDREQYIIGGLAKAASSALKKFFNKSSREDFSIKNLIEDYDKLSPKQAQKKFDKNIADLKGKDFDMFMVNEVNLSAEERAFVKSNTLILQVIQLLMFIDTQNQKKLLMICIQTINNKH